MTHHHPSTFICGNRERTQFHFVAVIPKFCMDGGILMKCSCPGECISPFKIIFIIYNNFIYVINLFKPLLRLIVFWSNLYTYTDKNVYAGLFELSHCTRLSQSFNNLSRFVAVMKILLSIYQLLKTVYINENTRSKSCVNKLKYYLHYLTLVH